MSILTPRAAANLMRLARDAVANRAIRPVHLVVMDHLLFRARQPGRDRTQVSYTSLAANLRMRREDLVKAMKALEAAGLLTKIRTWIKVLWQGFTVNRQGENIYVFQTGAPESERRTVFREERKTRGCPYTETGVLTERKRPTAALSPAQIIMEEALTRMAAAGGFTMPD